eukprot:3473839-Prymnesium_polylepis.1
MNAVFGRWASARRGACARVSASIFSSHAFDRCRSSAERLVGPVCTLRGRRPIVARSSGSWCTRRSRSPGRPSSGGFISDSIGGSGTRDDSVRSVTCEPPKRSVAVDGSIARAESNTCASDVWSSSTSSKRG